MAFLCVPRVHFCPCPVLKLSQATSLLPVRSHCCLQFSEMPLPWDSDRGHGGLSLTSGDPWTGHSSNSDFFFRKLSLSPHSLPLPQHVWPRTKLLLSLCLLCGGLQAVCQGGTKERIKGIRLSPVVSERTEMNEKGQGRSRSAVVPAWGTLHWGSHFWCAPKLAPATEYFLLAYRKRQDPGAEHHRYNWWIHGSCSHTVSCCPVGHQKNKC